MTTIPWFAPETGEREKQLLLQVLDSNYLNEGNITREFENKIAAFLGVKHCVAVTSGTSAITLSLMALGIKPGDQVIVPDFTFVATANAVRLAGADVVLADIEEKRLNISIQSIEKCLTSKTRAIVTVDVNGRGAQYEWIESFCKKNKLHLVCDSAEALGSKYNGRFLGTYGDAGCFSFSSNKTLTTGQGGMIATNNSDTYYRLCELKDQGRRYRGTGGNDRHPVMGYNFKFTNLQAAVGLAQFEKLAGRLEQAQKRDAWYLRELGKLKGLKFPDYSHEGEVRQWTDVLVEDLDAFTKILDEAQIGYRRFWYPIHEQEPYAVKDSRFPHAERVSRQGLWLASSFSLTEDQVLSISKTIKSRWV